LKARFALVLIFVIPAWAFGQTSNMISISALRQESDVASAYSPADMKQLMKTAHTEQEFGEIAAYFDRQAEMYAARYEAEETELYRLLALPYHARSYPAQVEAPAIAWIILRLSHTNAPSRPRYTACARKRLQTLVPALRHPLNNAYRCRPPRVRSTIRSCLSLTNSLSNGEEFFTDLELLCCM
jgi:hypothetical protein